MPKWREIFGNSDKINSRSLASGRELSYYIKYEYKKDPYSEQ